MNTAYHFTYEGVSTYDAKRIKSYQEAYHGVSLEFLK
jgi:hypothetical protein